jgi:hypothetical protein
MNDDLSAGRVVLGNRLRGPADRTVQAADRLRRAEQVDLIIRVPKSWPDTSRPASEAGKTAIGAFLSGVICWIFATRALSSSMRAGIYWVVRVHAHGDRQFERTLNRLILNTPVDVAGTIAAPARLAM